MPEIVLVNSHDGKSSYNLSSGIYRLACANGLLSPEGAQSNIKVRHSGKGIIERVIEGTFSIVDDIPRVLSRIKEYEEIDLSQSNQKIFAEQAAKELMKDEIVDINSMLFSRRKADDKSDLWTVSNRVQESLIRGYVARKKMDPKGNLKKVAGRQITSIDRSLEVNRLIANLTEAMAVSLTS